MPSGRAERGGRGADAVQTRDRRASPGGAGAGALRPTDRPPARPYVPRAGRRGPRRAESEGGAPAARRPGLRALLDAGRGHPGRRHRGAEVSARLGSPPLLGTPTLQGPGTCLAAQSRGTGWGGPGRAGRSFCCPSGLSPDSAFRLSLEDPADPKWREWEEGPPSPSARSAPEVDRLPSALLELSVPSFLGSPPVCPDPILRLGLEGSKPSPLFCCPTPPTLS